MNVKGPCVAAGAADAKCSAELPWLIVDVDYQGAGHEEYAFRNEAFGPVLHAPAARPPLPCICSVLARVGGGCECL